MKEFLLILVIVLTAQLHAQVISVHPQTPRNDSVWYYNVDKDVLPYKMYCRAGESQYFRLPVSSSSIQKNYIENTITTDKKKLTDDDKKTLEEDFNKENAATLDDIMNQENADRQESFDMTLMEELEEDCEKEFNDLMSKWHNEDFSICIPDCPPTTQRCELFIEHKRLEAATVGYRFKLERIWPEEFDEDEEPPYEVEMHYSLEYYSEAWVYFKISCECTDIPGLLSVSPKDENLLSKTPKGTGQTTGPIATISVTNTGIEPIVVSPQTLYIPSDGMYQSYVGRIPEGITIPPGATVEIPVYGYCTDGRLPSVPDGEDMPPLDTWVPVQPPSGSPKTTGEETVAIVPAAPVPGFTPDDIPGIRQTPGYSPIGPADENEVIVITYPGTDILVGGTIDPHKAPRTYAPVIVHVVETIEDATTVIQNDTAFTTPFTNDPGREEEAIIQQTIWVYMGALTGDPYEKDDFTGNVYDQFQDNTGVAVTALTDDQKEQIDSGIEDFWTVFVATGVEAKVLKETTPGVTISGPGEPVLPNEEDIPPPEIVDGSCILKEEIADTGPMLEYAIADTGTKEMNEEVKESFKAAIEQAAGIISDAKRSDTVDVEFTTPEMPASAWSLYFPHVVAGRANATAMALNMQNPLESAWTTEPIETKANGTRTVVLTHVMDEDCTSTLIGINLAKVRAGSGMDFQMGNLEIARVLNFVGEVAIDIVIHKGKGTFKKLSKYLKEKVKDMAKDQAKEFIKEELKKLGDQLEGKTDEEAEETMDELLEQIKSGEEDPEEDEFLEEWLAEMIVEGAEFNPAEKIVDDIIDNFDSPIDWAPIKTNTYALAEGSLDLWVNDVHDQATAASGVRYKRKGLEDAEETVKGGGIYCKHGVATDVSSGKIILRTKGLTESYAGATGEGIFSTGHGVATATLESFNGMYVIAICECPDGVWYDTYSSTTGFTTQKNMAGVWNLVFENLMNDVADQLDKDLGALPGGQGVSQDFIENVQKNMEAAASHAASVILPCK